MTKEGKKSAIPEQVEGTRQAWRVTAVLQLLLAAVTTAIYWLHPEMPMSPSTAKESSLGFSKGQIDAAMKASIVIAFFFAVGLCIASFTVTEQMCKRSEGARIVLIIGSPYLALSTLISLFSSTASKAGMPAFLVLISGVVRITSAIAAVTGLVLATSKGSKDYSGHQRPSEPWIPSVSGSHLSRVSKHGTDPQQQQQPDQPQPKQSKQSEEPKQ